MERTDRRDNNVRGHQQKVGGTNKKKWVKYKSAKIKRKKQTTWRKLNRLEYEEQRKEEGQLKDDSIRER